MDKDLVIDDTISALHIPEFNYEKLVIFTVEDKELYFGFKDEKWQCWGDAPIDATAKLFFDEVLAGYIEEYIKNKDK